jgi:hypothetical protein
MGQASAYKEVRLLFSIPEIPLTSPAPSNLSPVIGDSKCGQARSAVQRAVGTSTTGSDSPDLRHPAQGIFPLASRGRLRHHYL